MNGTAHGTVIVISMAKLLQTLQFQQRPLLTTLRQLPMQQRLLMPLCQTPYMPQFQQQLPMPLAQRLTQLLIQPLIQLPTWQQLQTPQFQMPRML
jgi:hypothetical protein